MTYRRLVALGAVTLGLPFTACGDYADKEAESPTSTTASAATTGNVTSSTVTSGGVSTTAASATVGTTGTTGFATDAGSVTTGAGGSTTDGGTSTTGPIEASCENVTACGGDVVGTWAVAGSCLPVTGVLDMTGFGLNCSTAPIDGALEVTGTLTLSDDGKVTDNTTTTGEAEIAMAAECLTLSGTVTTCDRLEDPILARGFATADCVDDAETGGCSCTASADQAGGMGFLSLDYWETANYTTADNTLTVSVFGDPWEYAYCVEETTLTMTPQTVSKIGTVAGTIALLKQ